MEIIHDWPDGECLAILSAVRRAAAPGASVLVIETMLLVPSAFTASCISGYLAKSRMLAHDRKRLKPHPRGRSRARAARPQAGHIMRAISRGRERTARQKDERFRSARFINQTPGALRMVQITAV